MSKVVREEPLINNLEAMKPNKAPSILSIVEGKLASFMKIIFAEEYANRSSNSELNATADTFISVKICYLDTMS